MNISAKNITEDEIHTFSGWASDLGLRPGQWPEKIEIEGGIGNNMPLLRTSKRLTPDGDIARVTYVQVAGCVRLHIMND